ncbi:transglycosylase SLT domain-containing protein [Pseudoduganella plicata]|nr:transglycosylase SLT domain-containing protein [Pseudoduganella plicata]
MRSVVRLVQVIGVLALAGLLYAWRHPDSLNRWSARSNAAGATAQEAQGKPATGDTAAVAAAMPAPRSVTGAQAAVARWIGVRYGVAPDAIAPLVAEADILGRKYGLSPNLLIAVMAIESNFHPYIESQAGAQGLMQVMPQVHSGRYEKFGGKSAFVDPMVSLRVGAEILRDCVRLRGGSEAEGLRFYFGGGPSSATYIEKVRAEQQRLNAVARGAHVPTTG